MNDLTYVQYQTRHEHVLRRILNSSHIPAPRIKDAMEYTLLSGGKRLRPLLVYFCGALVQVPVHVLDIIAVAIELIHCYSLIHDDLPAMDNDDFRRGKPSCHRAFDEATAILVGDGLQALAIEILLHHLPAYLSAEKIIIITHDLVKACGPSGMVSGQSLDLSELSQPDMNDEALRHIHQLKTGYLINACIHMVLHAASPTVEAKKALLDFSTPFGLVFQMQDDYLDRYADVTHLGKGRSSDLANQKITFADLYSKNQLELMIDRLFQKAITPLTHVFGGQAESLITFLAHIKNREQCVLQKT